jgi:hypothetical protein
MHTCLAASSAQLEAIGHSARGRAMERHGIAAEAARLHQLFKQSNRLD